MKMDKNKLHMEIMNLPIHNGEATSELFKHFNKVTSEMVLALKIGHKMARHQAADLIIKELKEN